MPTTEFDFLLHRAITCAKHAHHPFVVQPAGEQHALNGVLKDEHGAIFGFATALNAARVVHAYVMIVARARHFRNWPSDFRRIAPVSEFRTRCARGHDPDEQVVTLIRGQSHRAGGVSADAVARRINRLAAGVP